MFTGPGADTEWQVVKQETPDEPPSKFVPSPWQTWQYAKPVVGDGVAFAALPCACGSGGNVNQRPPTGWGTAWLWHIVPLKQPGGRPRGGRRRGRMRISRVIRPRVRVAGVAHGRVSKARACSCGCGHVVPAEERQGFGACGAATPWQTRHDTFEAPPAKSFPWHAWQPGNPSDTVPSILAASPCGWTVGGVATHPCGMAGLVVAHRPVEAAGSRPRGGRRLRRVRVVRRTLEVAPSAHRCVRAVRIRVAERSAAPRRRRVRRGDAVAGAAPQGRQAAGEVAPVADLAGGEPRAPRSFLCLRPVHRGARPPRRRSVVAAGRVTVARRAGDPPGKVRAVALRAAAVPVVGDEVLRGDRGVRPAGRNDQPPCDGSAGRKHVVHVHAGLAGPRLGAARTRAAAIRIQSPVKCFIFRRVLQGRVMSSPVHLAGTIQEGTSSRPLPHSVAFPR